MGLAVLKLVNYALLAGFNEICYLALKAVE
jgi:hypothetical protein